MALQNYIEKLAEQNDSDVIYSKQPEVVTKIVPPEKSNQRLSIDEHVKVITPNNKDDSIVIKFTNLRVSKSNTQQKQQTNTSVKGGKFNLRLSTKKKESELNQNIKPQEIKREEKIVEKQETELETIERLFAESLTKNQFKDLWIEKYKTAKAGKSLGKENVYAEKIKKGEFQIDELEGIPRVFPFSDYDTRSKNVDEILNDKWLKNK